MPPPARPLTVAAAMAVVEAAASAPAAPTGAFRVGLESEVLPVRLAGGGAPVGRALLAQTWPRLRTAAAALYAPTNAPAEQVQDSAGGLPTLRWRGGRLAPEPGGQLEYAGPPHAGPSAALADAAAAHTALTDALEPLGVVQAPIGMDVWSEPADVPQQLRAPRYPAMASYLSGLGPSGHRMMCCSASLQVNVDLGPPAVASSRWVVANLVAPLVTATFACSPDRSAVNARARVWQRLDPSRTGFPRALLEGVDEPAAALWQAAVDANVLLVRRRGTMLPGTPGWTFASWWADGHPEYGPPTVEDLRYHLTTLFPEVRLRGFLELRGVDALPLRWQAAPVVLLSGLLYDDVARERVRGVLERHRAELPQLWLRAAMAGVADPELCALAVEVWSLARDGAARLPEGLVQHEHLRIAETFIDRFTLRGRSPSDELRAQLRRSAAAALRWSADPLAERVLR